MPMARLPRRPLRSCRTCSTATPDVLLLYPMDLVAAEERFGSWMTQYGYANVISADKLLERGAVNAGGINLAGRRFTTLHGHLGALPSERLLQFMKDFAESGGRLVWAGPPPLITREDTDALAPWQALFGVNYAPPARKKQSWPPAVWSPSPARSPRSRRKSSSRISSSTASTPCNPQRARKSWQRSRPISSARIAPWAPAARPSSDSRLRDDQSQSLGYDERTLFNVLNALGAYAPTGVFPDVNDNTDYLSRTGEVLACRFPNGTLAFAPHLKTLEEGWTGRLRAQGRRRRGISEGQPTSPEPAPFREFPGERPHRHL